ncbi:unnamed protein product [Fusarium graminearum]|nr:hypothetical protein HG531_011128 [Fusarium graminearum]PCD36983.1 hypothetical protein FGRA07_07987 [Fusarium graminearum]CAG1974215.1 unnamed protein product [Fusarium graminearum]CAG1981098.1 unnamed protein product [Fusarium graminearum]VTO90656.1 unnamed protein product [Fusarium graminearum]
MIRLQPTTITLTASEMTDAERHSRYRKHLANRECTTRTRWSTALENEETTLEHAMNTRIQTPDTDPSNRQRIRSSPSPDVLAREEDFTYSTSSAGNGIDREVGAVRLPIRTRFANVINDTIHQDDNEGRTVQQLLTTVDSLETTNRTVDTETMASMIAAELNVTPPRRNLSVYSDALPVNGQPQTPRQLLEARHQSRFNGAYTAPVRGRRIEADVGDAPVTVRRRRAGRNTSLVGLSLELHGLHEDSQNTNDV